MQIILYCYNAIGWFRKLHLLKVCSGRLLFCKALCLQCDMKYIIYDFFLCQLEIIVIRKVSKYISTSGWKRALYYSKSKILRSCLRMLKASKERGAFSFWEVNGYYCRQEVHGHSCNMHWSSGIDSVTW